MKRTDKTPKLNKVSGLVEEIFAQAVALDQNGGLRNSIYADGKEIYILNYDHTVIMRFRLRESETGFSEPISFNANDYDSNLFYEEEGKIVFLNEQGSYERKKTCGRASYAPDEIKNLLRGFLRNEAPREKLIIGRDILSLLDLDLSHIEFSGKKGQPLKLIQRNVYSGSVIEISEKKEGMFSEVFENDFGPVGIKTNDFVSLYSFLDALYFEFPSSEEADFIIFRSIDKNKRDLVGIIACCLYDELIELTQSKGGTK